MIPVLSNLRLNFFSAFSMFSPSFTCTIIISFFFCCLFVCIDAAARHRVSLLRCKISYSYLIGKIIRQKIEPLRCSRRKCPPGGCICLYWRLLPFIGCCRQSLLVIPFGVHQIVVSYLDVHLLGFLRLYHLDEFRWCAGPHLVCSYLGTAQHY